MDVVVIRQLGLGLYEPQAHVGRVGSDGRGDGGNGTLFITRDKRLIRSIYLTFFYMCILIQNRT